MCHHDHAGTTNIDWFK